MLWLLLLLAKCLITVYARRRVGRRCFVHVGVVVMIFDECIVVGRNVKRRVAQTALVGCCHCLSAVCTGVTVLLLKQLLLLLLQLKLLLVFLMKKRLI